MEMKEKEEEEMAIQDAVRIRSIGILDRSYITSLRDAIITLEHSSKPDLNLLTKLVLQYCVLFPMEINDVFVVCEFYFL